MNADVRLTPEAIKGKAFKKVRRGYRVGEVDQFLGRVARDVARLHERLAGRSVVSLDEEPLITPPQIQEKTFNGAWYGYAMYEVDDFLDMLVVSVERLHQALAEAEQWHSARRAPRGYSVEEVDQFLGRVAV